MLQENANPVVAALGEKRSVKTVCRCNSTRALVDLWCAQDSGGGVADLSLEALRREHEEVMAAEARVGQAEAEASHRYDDEYVLSKGHGDMGNGVSTAIVTLDGHSCQGGGKDAHTCPPPICDGGTHQLVDDLAACLAPSAKRSRCA